MTRLPALLILPLLLAGCDAFVPRDDSFGETQTRITMRKNPEAVRQQVSAKTAATGPVVGGGGEFSDDSEVDPNYKEPAPEVDDDAAVSDDAPDDPSGGW